MVSLALPASAGAAATRAEYVAQADPVCAVATKEIDAAGKGALSNLKKLKFKAAAREYLAAARAFDESIASLRLIAPPAADAALIDRWLRKQSETAAVIRRAAKLARQKRVRELSRAGERSVKLAEESARVVAGFGFQACA